MNHEYSAAGSASRRTRPPIAQVADGGHDAPVWQRVHDAMHTLALHELLLYASLTAVIPDAASPATLIAGVLARRLGGRDLPEGAIRELFADILAARPAIIESVGADLEATVQRDPACPGHLHALLNLKGFHALQTYRIAHALWSTGRKDMAHAISAHASAVFGVDIHPAARIGAGIMLDHGTGIVIGETAVIEDNVSILQCVTLGGTGKEAGDRHPKIRRGVTIGAGATILGNIEVGAMSRIGAGSVVLSDVPPYCTVAGVPGRIVRRNEPQCVPARDMRQLA